MKGGYLARFPFFSSWLNTDAASFLTSLVVGFFAPDSTLEANVDVLSEDCFFGMTFLLSVYDNYSN